MAANPETIKRPPIHAARKFVFAVVTSPPTNLRYYNTPIEINVVYPGE